MNSNKSNHSHGHKHGTDDKYGHSHGVIDPSIVSHERGLWAVKWSFAGLAVTAIIQVFVVAVTHSVALLADTIHNVGDAATAIPLGIAFLFARRKPSKRFTYGYGRVEDLAGVVVVLLILFSAIVAAYQAVQRFIHPEPVYYLWALAAASIVGFVGNEAVAFFRIKVGKEIGSAALIADGYHARTDGWTSLAVLGGAIGTWLGFPLADPIIGLLISAAIFFIVWDSAKSIFTRMLDGVDPGVLEKVGHAARHVNEVKDLGEVRARWIGHKLWVELNISVRADMPITDAHEIAKEVRHQLMHHLPHLGEVIIHVDPEHRLGEGFHKIGPHSHGTFGQHSHH